MKRSATLLIAIALASSAHAGLITDPLSIQAPAPASTPVGDPATILPGGVIDGGLTTDPLGTDAPASATSPTSPANPQPKAVIDFTSAKKWINDLIGAQPDGEALRLPDLMMIPDVFEALHATGREADELRGYMDWLLMTGVVVGLDGDDGLDDLTGDPEDGLYSGQGDDELFGGGGDDELSDHVTSPVPNGIILGGPGGDTVQPHVLVNGFVFGTTSYMTGATPSVPNGIILGGPGSDTLHPQAPINGFVFGTTSYMTGATPPVPNSIILGGPGGDTVHSQALIDGFVFGEVVYLAGDSQDHNPDVAND